MFGRHRTYHLRESWIAKGLSALCRAETEGRADNVFLRPDAPEHFGIGPGMLQALRFWMVACGLMQEQRSAHRVPKLTPFGRLLARHDPFLERLGTVWLLHGELVSNRHHAPTWFWFFNAYASSRGFEQEPCLDALHWWAIASYPARITARTALQKDLACLLRMYDGARQATSPEDGTASPFARLRRLPSSREEHKKNYHLHALILLYLLTSRKPAQGGCEPLPCLADTGAGCARTGRQDRSPAHPKQAA